MATKKEHTLNEVYGLLTDFFGFTKNQFEKIEERFGKQDKVLNLMNEQMNRFVNLERSRF